MSVELRNRIEQYVRDLQSAQERLSAVYERKQSALTAAESEQLLEIAQSEAVLTEEFQSLLAERSQILNAAGPQWSDRNLQELAAFVAPDNASLRQRIERVRHTAHELRTQSWIHWIISHRTYQHYTEILNIIANHGRPSPVYSRDAQPTTTGGAVLDASA